MVEATNCPAGGSPLTVRPSLLRHPLGQHRGPRNLRERAPDEPVIVPVLEGEHAHDASLKDVAHSKCAGPHVSQDNLQAVGLAAVKEDCLDLHSFVGCVRAQEVAEAATKAGQQCVQASAEAAIRLAAAARLH